MYDTTYIKIPDTILLGIDTFLIPIIEESIVLAPVRNLEASARKILSFVVPPEAQEWMFWMGVGKDAKRRYDQVKESAPSSWESQDMPSPLHAYAKRRLKWLPQIKDARPINFFIANEDQSNRFIQNRTMTSTLVSRTNTQSAYSRRSKRSANEQKLALCFEHQDFISPIDVYIHLIGMSIVPRYDYAERDSMIVTVRPVEIDLAEKDFSEAKKELDDLQLQLLQARLQLEREVAQKLLYYDSLLQAQNIIFDAMQAEITKQEQQIQDKKQLKEEKRTPEEANALAKFQRAQSELEALKIQVIVLKQQLEALQKIKGQPSQGDMDFIKEAEKILGKSGTNN